MLVLTRKQEETIVINGQIEIKVVKITGNKVRLGIRAPEDYKVLRGEVSPFDVEFEVAMEEFNSLREANAAKKAEAKERKTLSAGKRSRCKSSKKKVIAEVVAQCEAGTEQSKRASGLSQPLRSRVEARNRLTQEMFDRESNNDRASDEETVYPNAFFVV